MGIGKRERGGPARTAVDNGLHRHEIEADVLEIWIGVSRLMARLTQSERPPARRKARQRRMRVPAPKPPGPKPPAARAIP